MYSASYWDTLYQTLHCTFLTTLIHTKETHYATKNQANRGQNAKLDGVFISEFTVISIPMKVGAGYFHVVLILKMEELDSIPFKTYEQYFLRWFETEK